MNKIPRTVGYAIAVGLGIVGIIVGAGCGKKSRSAMTSPPDGSTHFFSVSVEKIAFSSSSLTIAAGDTGRWTNNDQDSPTVTSDARGELGGCLGRARPMSASSHPRGILPITARSTAPCVDR